MRLRQFLTCFHSIGEKQGIATGTLKTIQIYLEHGFPDHALRVANEALAHIGEAK